MARARRSHVFAALLRMACAWGLLCGGLGPALAQSAPAQPLTRAAAQAAAREARGRDLARQRAALARAYAAERAQCMHRFLVFACLDDAARRERLQRDALRAQQMHLRLLAREQRAQQELQRVRMREAAHAAPGGAMPILPAAGLEHPLPGQPAARDMLPRPLPQRALEARSRARAARRLQRQRRAQYQDLRQRVQRQQQQSPAAPPLPLPAASGPLRLPR